MHSQRVRAQRVGRLQAVRRRFARGGSPARVVSDGSPRSPVRDLRLASGSPGRTRLAACLLAIASIAGALPAAALPTSLRSGDDVQDLTDVFVRQIVAGDVGNAYRSLVPFWPASAQRRAAEVVAAEKRRSERRHRLGLSLGSELVASEPAGERVLRLTYFERLDRGGVVWRLIFFKPENVWLLHSVSQSEDLAALYGPVATSPPIAPTPAPAAEPVLPPAVDAPGPRASP